MGRNYFVVILSSFYFFLSMHVRKHRVAEFSEDVEISQYINKKGGGGGGAMKFVHLEQRNVDTNKIKISKKKTEKLEYIEKTCQINKYSTLFTQNNHLIGGARDSL